MAKQKKPVHRVQMTEGKRNNIHQRLEEYDIQTVKSPYHAQHMFCHGAVLPGTSFQVAMGSNVVMVIKNFNKVILS